MDEIQLVAYDPAWPAQFVEERQRIATAFATAPKLIEHIGSTAIAGLAAKPVIDIAVLLDDLADGHAAIPVLEAMGYSFWRDNPVKTKLFLVKGLPNRTHHMHIHTDASEVTRHLVFRDALRADPAVLAAYAALKTELAQCFRHDREAYTNAKSAFVDQIVAKCGGPART